MRAAAPASGLGVGDRNVSGGGRYNVGVGDGDGSRVLVDAPKLNRSGSVSRNGFDEGSKRGIASGGLAPSKKVSIGNK